MENLKDSIKNEGSISQKIDEELVYLINKGDKEKLNFFIKLHDINFLYTEEMKIFYCINEFMQGSISSEKKQKILEILNNNKYVKSVKAQEYSVYKIPEFIVDTQDGIIKALQFSSVVPDIKKSIPYIETKQRNGKCFDLAYLICTGVDKESDIVIGYVYGNCDKSKFLHSWVETCIGGEEVVIDGTVNAVINKSGYYRMKHAEVLNRISKKDVIEDTDNYLAKYQKIDKDFHLEYYYLYRDELIRSLKDNKNLSDLNGER